MKNKIIAFVLISTILISTIRVCQADNGQSETGKQALPVALNKNKTVLLDKQKKRLLLKTRVVLREGLLEMLLCKNQTKEHESILAIDAPAYVIHTGLLALGCKPGTPVRFEPKFQFPTGQHVAIYLNWKDKQGKAHRTKAQEWIRHVTRRFYLQPLAELPAEVEFPEESIMRYDRENKELHWFGIMSKSQRDQFLKLSQDKIYQAAIEKIYRDSQPKPMSAHWVFPGSGFYKDEQTGERMYLAEEGYVICVANFGAAMLDVARKSSASGETNLLYEANPERVPPLGTEVTVELIPVQPEQANAPEKKTE